MSVVCAGACSAGDQDIAAVGDRTAENPRLLGRHDAGGHIVLQREHGDRGLADRKGRRRDHGRQQALEALPRSGQLGRDTGASGVDLGADMVGDEPDNALAVGRRQSLTRIGQALREPVDPEPPVRVEHHLDDRRVFQETGDGRAEGGAQHARAAKDRLGLLE